MIIRQTGADPSFTLEGGTISIEAVNRWLMLLGGEFNYASGLVEGDGVWDVQNVTLNGNPFTNTMNLSLRDCVVNADVFNEGNISGASPLYNGRFQNEPAGTLRVQGTTHTFAHASGLVNHGTIMMGDAGGAPTLSVPSGQLINHGDIVMGPNQPTYIAAEVINEPTGMIESANGASLTINKPDADHVNRGHIRVRNENMIIRQTGADPSFTLEGGMITTESQGRYPTFFGGSLILAGGAVTGPGLLRIENGALRGSGVIASPVAVANGRVAPGNRSETLQGQITVDNSFASIGSGSIDIDISGPPGPGVGADQFNVAGSLTFTGAVNVFVNGGYLPVPNDVYEIITYGSHSGSFSPINAPCPAGRRLEESVGLTMLTLEVFDPAGDTNCDCSVDAFDIEPFIVGLVDPVGYATRYPGCDINNVDCNRDGVIDAFDIEPFINILLGGP